MLLNGIAYDDLVLPILLKEGNSRIVDGMVIDANRVLSETKILGLRSQRGYSVVLWGINAVLIVAVACYAWRHKWMMKETQN